MTVAYPFCAAQGSDRRTHARRQQRAATLPGLLLRGVSAAPLTSYHLPWKMYAPFCHRRRLLDARMHKRMKTLIVHAHPEPGSFTGAMKQVAVETLRRAGHEVRVSDLYEMRFNPVASSADFQARTNNAYLLYALEQRHADKTNTLAEDIAAEIEKVVCADLVIFSFPVFWFSVPAIMKGWIDHVFVSGRFYAGMRFYDRGCLHEKRALLALTLGGQRHMFPLDGIHGPLDDMLRPLLRGT